MLKNEILETYKEEIKESAEAYYYKEKLFTLNYFKNANDKIVKNIYASYPKSYYDIGSHKETVSAFMNAKLYGEKIK